MTTSSNQLLYQSRDENYIVSVHRNKHGNIYYLVKYKGEPMKYPVRTSEYVLNVYGPPGQAVLTYAKLAGLL